MKRWAKNQECFSMSVFFESFYKWVLWFSPLTHALRNSRVAANWFFHLRSTYEWAKVLFRLKFPPSQLFSYLLQSLSYFFLQGLFFSSNSCGGTSGGSCGSGGCTSGGSCSGRLFGCVLFDLLQGERWAAVPGSRPLLVLLAEHCNLGIWGPNSIETFGLSFCLKNHLNFGLRLPYMKRMFKNV